MTTTTKLGLELLANAAANQTLANTTFAQLNQLVQPAAVDKDLATPPGSPADEALYIVASSPTGAWSGKAGNLAYWLTSTGVWQFIVPREGMLVHVNDEDVYYKYSGSAWEILGNGDVVGPSIATNNDVARFDGITGKLLKAGLKYQTSMTDTTAGALIIQGGTNLVSSDAVAIGYAPGSGGSVTQATSKATSVTLNKPTGRITTAADALAAGASVTFDMSNTSIAITDVIVLNMGGAAAVAANYRVEVVRIAVGNVVIRLTNISAGSRSEALIINFAVIKGAVA